MKTLKFNKDPDGWFIDLPEWTGGKASLEMVAGADKLLEKLSEGKGTVTLVVTEELKDTVFDNKFEKISKIMNTPGGGALYSTNHWPIWLCDVTKFVFDGRFPKKLYYKIA